MDNEIVIKSSLTLVTNKIYVYKTIYLTIKTNVI